jgi:hypothetical protein
MWPEKRALPPTLWGPRFWLHNAMGDVQIENGTDVMFGFANRATGRMTRWRIYSVTVDTPMDLHNFPWDVNSIVLDFHTNSTYLSFDGNWTGSSTGGRTYRLRQTCMHGEGDWLTLGWSGDITEWELHGVSTKIDELPPSHSGLESTTVVVCFHVSRRWAYYFWKVLVPLYLLTGLSMSTFEFEVDNVSDRTSTISTYFVAAFAVLYVVSVALPKTNFLTKIDALIVCTLLALAFTGVATAVLARVHEYEGQEVAEMWNLIALRAIAAVYILANVTICAKPVLLQMCAVHQLNRHRPLDASSRPLPTQDAREYSRVSGEDAEDTEAWLPGTVLAGFDYVTLAELKAQLDE